MSTRNEDRLGLPDLDAGQSPPPVQNKAPGQPQSFSFEFSMPTEFVELPSKGKYYPPDHPLRDKEVIEVKHMTTKEEDILNSQALAKEGKLMDRLIDSVIVDRSVRSSSLLVADRNAILVALRITNYGEIYEPDVPCPNCQTVSRQKFDLKECGGIEDEEEQELKLEVEKTNNGTFIIKNLPLTKWNFEVKPLTGVEEEILLKKTEKMKKMSMREGILTTQISLFTVSINGETDELQILKAINSLPARDSRYLRKTYKQIMPSVDMSVLFECSSCGYEGGIGLPFTAEFFWSDR